MRHITQLLRNCGMNPIVQITFSKNLKIVRLVGDGPITGIHYVLSLKQGLDGFYYLVFTPPELLVPFTEVDFGKITNVGKVACFGEFENSLRLPIISVPGLDGVISRSLQDDLDFPSNFGRW